MLTVSGILTSECGITYIVAFGLEPVEGLLCAIGAVPGGREFLAKVGVRTAPTGYFRCRERYFGDRVRDVALEPIHVVCDDS